MAQNFESRQNDIVDGGGSAAIYIYNDAKRLFKKLASNISRSGQEFADWLGKNDRLDTLYKNIRDKKDFEANADKPANSKDAQKHINKLWSELTQVSLKFQRDKYSEVNDGYAFLPESSPVHTFWCSEYSVDPDKILIKDEGGDITIDNPTLGEYAMAIEMAMSDMEGKMEKIDKRAQGAMNRIAGRKLAQTNDILQKQNDIRQRQEDGKRLEDLEREMENLT